MRAAVALLAAALCLCLANAQQSSDYVDEMRLGTFNILSEVYNNPNWFVIAPEYITPFNYYDDTYRINKLLENMDTIIDTGLDFAAFQEVSQQAPCLTNPSIILPGHLTQVLAKMTSRGYQCHFAAHDITHWSKYYDYENCNVYNSYRPTGNVACIKTASFETTPAPVFFTDNLVNGSAIAAVNATFKGAAGRTHPVTLASIHFDSDVAGIRRKEFVATFFENHLPQLERPFIACGDYNTFWEPANLRMVYLDSGYTDPLFDWSLANGVPLPPSQPLTEGWYNSRNHRSRIDHCLVPIGSAILNDQLFITDRQQWYGYPNATDSGVVDFKLWTEYPAPAKQGFDATEPTRNGETLKRWGSDHYGVRYNIKLSN